jgi:hypothetical protein
MRRRQRPEQIIHKSVVAHLRARAVPGVVFLHPASGEARNAVTGAILKGLGVMPGAPDLLLWAPSESGCKSFALEIKSEDGRVSESQADMLRRLADAGVITAVTFGLNAAVERLETWQLLRGRMR